MPIRTIIISNELKEVLTKINSAISTTLLGESVEESMLTDKEVNYLDLSTTTKGHLSYLTKERIEKITKEDECQNFWNAKMRYHARPGSVLKKMFSFFRDYEIEHFTTQFLSITDPPVYRMLVVKGTDIAKYYDHANYFEQKGSLGGSCMKAVNERFFDIYVNNPDFINMLVMLNQNDKVMGRAVLWLGKDFKVLDRVYVCNDLYIKYFKSWAQENSCYYKEYNNWYTPKHMMLGDESVFADFEIKLNVSKFDKYPYLDSFKWLNTKTNKISNFKPKTSRNVITISDHMGGHFKADYFDFCDFTNNLYLSCDITWLSYIHKKAYTGDTVRSNINDTAIFMKHAQYDDELKDYIFNQEYNQFNDISAIEKKKQEIKEKKSQKTISNKEKVSFNFIQGELENPCAEVTLKRPWAFVEGRDFDREL